MSHQPSESRTPSPNGDQGRLPGLAVWALYILSIPSANTLVLVGLVIAYVARGSASGAPRQHLDAQIRLFWSAFWWTVACWIGIGVSIVLSFVLIGIPLLLLFGLAWFLISVWFTVKSVFGLLHLLANREP